MVPLLAKQSQVGDWKAFRYTYRKRLSWISGLTGGGYLIFLLLGELLLRLLIGQGAVTDAIEGHYFATVKDSLSHSDSCSPNGSSWHGSFRQSKE
jgi:hypothetical protein